MRGKKSDNRIKAKHFSWKEFFVTFSVLVVLGIGQALVLSVCLTYLDFNMVPIVFAVVMVVYWIIVAAVYSLVTHYQMRKKFDEPFQQLGEAAERVAYGDFSFYLSPIHTADKRDYVDVMFEDFNKMVKELGSIETLKNDFVANVSHEIKTPLNIIRNYAHALKEKRYDIDEWEEYLDTIIGSADNLTALVTNILKLNRLENQEILPIAEPYDLCGQLSDIVMALDKPLDDKNINLAVEMDDRLMIRYDPGMIELV